MAGPSKVSQVEYKLKWQMLSPTGPSLLHHVGCLINNCLYVHGGIDKVGSTNPLNGLYKMDLETGIWEQVRAAGSPSLSHHACVVQDERYMVLIGGWDGKRRSKSVWGFDTQENVWITCSTSGFPEGAGLSSHTANMLTNGDILIVGREGSLRIQRRTGEAFMLRGRLPRTDYKWSEVPMVVNSRSGHTANILGQTLVVIGGRNDKPFELHNGFKGAYSGAKQSNEVISRVWGICKQMKPMAKPPGGRKNHISVEGSGGVLIHGGETFDGRTRVPVGEMFLLALKPHLQWYKLGDSGLGRAGHVTCCSTGKVVIHAGKSGKATVHGDSYELQVSEVKH